MEIKEDGVNCSVFIWQRISETKKVEDGGKLYFSFGKG